MKYLPALLIAIVLSGCSAVYTTKPVGENPKNLTHEVPEWEGVWCNAEGDTFKVNVADPAKGLLQVAGIEEKGNTFELKKYTIHLRESGNWCFASCRNEDVKDRDLYVWARISRDGRQIIFWAPDTDKFKQLVTKGQLPGKIEKDEVVLGELDPKQMELITSGSNGVLLQWEKPMILTKVSK
ncbi:MAG: hypothetical protein WCH43_01005 [Verrucomicrobiota bacterium]